MATCCRVTPIGLGKLTPILLSLAGGLQPRVASITVLFSKIIISTSLVQSAKEDIGRSFVHSLLVLSSGYIADLVWTFMSSTPGTVRASFKTCLYGGGPKIPKTFEQTYVF